MVMPLEDESSAGLIPCKKSILSKQKTVNLRADRFV